MCQAEAAQVPPDRGAVSLNAMPVTQLGHQFINLGGFAVLDPASNPICHASQFAMPIPVALRLGRK